MNRFIPLLLIVSVISCIKNPSGADTDYSQFIGEPIGFSKGSARVTESNFWGYIDKDGDYIWSSD